MRTRVIPMGPDRGMPEVADNLLRGITLSGHDDPFLVIQFLTTELDTIQGGRSPSVTRRLVGTRLWCILGVCHAPI